MFNPIGTGLMVVTTAIFFSGLIISFIFLLIYRLKLREILIMTVLLGVCAGFLYSMNDLIKTSDTQEEKVLQSITYELNPIKINEKTYYGISGKDTMKVSVDDNSLKEAELNLKDIKIVESEKNILEKKSVMRICKLAPSNPAEKVFAALFFEKEPTEKKEIIEIYTYKDNILQ